jgi:hypothetical protein
VEREHRCGVDETAWSRPPRCCWPGTVQCTHALGTNASSKQGAVEAAGRSSRLPNTATPNSAAGGEAGREGDRCRLAKAPPAALTRAGHTGPWARREWLGTVKAGEQPAAFPPAGRAQEHHRGVRPVGRASYRRLAARSNRAGSPERLRLARWWPRRPQPLQPHESDTTLCPERPARSCQGKPTAARGRRPGPSLTSKRHLRGGGCAGGLLFNGGLEQSPRQGGGKERGSGCHLQRSGQQAKHQSPARLHPMDRHPPPHRLP